MMDIVVSYVCFLIKKKLYVKHFGQLVLFLNVLVARGAWEAGIELYRLSLGGERVLRRAVKRSASE